ncbi:unnamed protein product [Paramecium octaurelia]|uniref:G domain-containing protein n=1 Tax=Paramecium octaurelia TaxID=43137 RepID=A0A8S1V1K1_PAROT|nr:unnamed protein product [Paramecium octaurelia]
MSALRVVLLGILGHGKTYLFNKITNATEPVTYGGNSVTKQIVIGQAAHGEFEVVDTPGFDAQEDKLLHAAGVIAALAQGEVNRILIVIKCERTDIMIKNIKKIIEPISRYKDLITFIVTYWDEQQRSIQQHYKSQESQSKQELEAKQQIEAAIKKNYNISSVIFSSSQDDPIIITKQITNIILSSKFAKIHFSESEIFCKFDILSISQESELQLTNSILEIKKNFRNDSKLFLNFIETLKLDDKDLIEKLHFISLYIKSYANEYIEDFEKKYANYMNETYNTDGVNIRYLYHIYLKKELQMDLEQVIKKAQAKMKQSQNHCFNWIKQCPYCGLVWIKVIGCDSETTCGNRVNNYLDDLLIGPQKQQSFKVIKNDDSIHIETIHKEKDENKLISQQNLDICQILGDSLKNDPEFKYISALNNVNKGLISHVFGESRFKYYVENIDEVVQETMIIEFKHLLRKAILLSNEHGKVEVKDQKSLGCGRKIVWKDLPPLTGPLLQELLSSELLDYFNDKEQLLKDEADDITKELERTYKNLVNQAINEQQKSIRTIQKLETMTPTMNDEETQKQKQQSENLQKNYQNHIENTKREQNNIKEKYNNNSSIIQILKQWIFSSNDSQ